ncbi:hypothetical protein [Sphingomonas lenta]|uniref:Uncharacterized protein n=1 Tax=Sphingomonas lenta TaxID=1141887 RepID=A0A2A2SK38_9SPHN|nr:hypothetical protein [Sphingomonas lenta]PAX09644.1 hypothetical protein CKY28_02605 [Sphingomonas lenta]
MSREGEPWFRYYVGRGYFRAWPVRWQGWAALAALIVLPLLPMPIVRELMLTNPALGVAALLLAIAAPWAVLVPLVRRKGERVDG